MADEFTLKMPDFNPTINININGEEKLRDFVTTINDMMNGANYQEYYKSDNLLKEDMNILFKDYKTHPTSENVRELVNTYNAYLAKSGEIKSLPNDVFTATLNAKSKVSDTCCFSVGQFITAFSTYENLKSYGINLDEFFNLFSKN